MSITSELFNQQAEIVRRFENGSHSDRKKLCRICMQEHLHLHRLILIAGGKRVTPIMIDIKPLFPQQHDADVNSFLRFFVATRTLVMMYSARVDEERLPRQLARRLRLALIDIAAVTDAQLTKAARSKPT